MRRGSCWSKRVIDVVGASFGLIVLAPLFVAIALAIKSDSNGPVLFRQQRVGHKGAPFTIFKFRTMLVDADSEIHRRYVQSLIREGDSPALRTESGVYKLDADPRITRVGAWLRSSSIDELPQLVNVLRGEMSLVGPRPPLQYETELYTARHALRLQVKPGMTGLWQVSGRNGTNFEEMVDLDLAYIEQQCMRLDLSILARTVAVVASRNGH